MLHCVRLETNACQETQVIRMPPPPPAVLHICHPDFSERHCARGRRNRPKIKAFAFIAAALASRQRKSLERNDASPVRAIAKSTPVCKVRARVGVQSLGNWYRMVRDAEWPLSVL